jgi:hypothetical protein
MSSSDQRSLDERRASFRCPASDPRRRGRLRIGKREIPVEVLDESASGYSINCQQAEDCEVGQSLLLRVESTWTIVRVMNLQTSDGQTRLGLARVKDLEASDVERKQSEGFSIDDLKRLGRALAPLGRRAAGIVGLLLGGAFVGVFVIVALEHWAPLTKKVEHNDSRRIEDMTSPELPQTSEQRTSDRQAEHRPRKQQAAHPPTPADPREELSTTTEQPRQEVTAEMAAPEHVVRHSHPGFLLKPEIAKLLKLTREQMAELRQLFEETRSATAELLESDSDPAQSQQNMDLELGKRSLALLTPEQRQTVTRMLSNTLPADGATPDAANSPEAR